MNKTRISEKLKCFINTCTQHSNFMFADPSDSTDSSSSDLVNINNTKGNTTIITIFKANKNASKMQFF